MSCSAGRPSIPLIESLRRSFSQVTACAIGGAVVWLVWAAVQDGFVAFEATPYLPWMRAEPRTPLVIPSLFALPFLLMAHAHARRGRTMRSGRWFVWSLFVFSLVKVLPHGVYAAGWFIQPLLIAITAVAFGGSQGLFMACLAAAALGVSASTGQSTVWTPFPLDPMNQRADALGFALPVAGIFLVGGLVGSLLHRAMQGLFAVETEQRQRLERTLRALRQRERLLRHAMRVATIGEMAGMVVHQLRNKFQLIHGHIDLGLVAESNEKDMRLREIQKSVRAATGIVEHLLDLAHPADNVPCVVDLAVEGRTFADRVRAVLPSSIRLETVFSMAGLYVLLAPDELGDALLNLVINAKQAMRRGTIRIEAGFLEEARVYIAVSDDGPGIEPQLVSRLFTPFFTTKPRGRGTGLGLASVDRFVRMAGGKVEIDTTLGRGTTFRLTFPRAAAPGSESKVG